MCLELELLQQTDTSICFTWTNSGFPCRILRDGKVVYNGTAHSFKDEGLSPGELYIYTLEKLNLEGKVIERLKLQTGTENRRGESVNQLQQITVSTIVSPTKTAIAWGQIDGITCFDVYRNGDYIASTEKNQFTDLEADSKIAHTYRIHGKRRLERSEENKKHRKSLLATVFGMINVRSTQEQAATEEFWITKYVASQEQLLTGQPAPKNDVREPEWQLRYLTFLGEEVLPNPNLMSLDRFFKGDGRNFDPEAATFRTKVNLNVRFTDKQALIDCDKDIGTTIAYDWRKKFRKADVAPSSGIELQDIKEDPHKIAFTLKHCVGNPLVPSPDIDYGIRANFYRTGIYDIIGIHDQAPNHEVYLKNRQSDGWEKVHEAEDKGLSWMAGPIASQYWRISNFE